jgi:hypothetical protein
MPVPEKDIKERTKEGKKEKRIGAVFTNRGERMNPLHKSDTPVSSGSSTAARD